MNESRNPRVMPPVRADRPAVVFLSFCPTPGGVATYQALHISYLIDRARVTLLDEVPASTVDQLDPQVRSRLQVAELPLWSARGVARGALRRVLRLVRPRLIAIGNPALLLPYLDILLVARIRGRTRLMMTLHSGFLTMTMRRLVAEVFIAVASLLVHEIIYVSRFTRQYWLRRYPWMRLIPSRVIPNGVAMGDRLPMGRELPRVARIGFVGRLQEEKGVALFCEVAQLMTQRGGSDLEFHVFGEGPMEPLVRATPGVNWHGHVPDPDRIFGMIDLLLITSPVENSPFVVLEAKRHGVPTVAAAVGGLPELIISGSDGVLSQRYSSAALVQAVDEALARYPELSRGSAVSAGRFDIEQVGKETWHSHISGAMR